MTSNQCPGCQSSMNTVKHPDMTVNVCSKCGGAFFDKGEVNLAATGMSGDIELCSVDETENKDAFPPRKCMRCPDETMKKMALLCYSDIVLDYCGKCRGFFFDKGEIKAMNEELEKLAGSNRPEEYRQYHGKYLVRMDKLNVVMAGWYGMGIATVLTQAAYLRISVYYEKSLNAGLRIYSENWTDKLIKSLGLFKKQDIETGDAAFDASFIIQGDDVSRIKSILSADVRKKMLEFAQNPPKLLSARGKLQVLDKRILYTEGPYTGNVSYDMNNDPAGIAGRLIELAQLLS